MFGYDETTNEFTKFGEAVKEQGETSSHNPLGKKLVFDPKTGNFVVASKLNPFAAGDVVTEMTSKGFA